mgnify:CR=1 FL=1
MALRIAVFMPRNMRFGPSNATSIDMCVRDLVMSSRYRNTTTVICCENETLYTDVDVLTYSPTIDESTNRKVAFAAKEVLRLGADLVVVQQHLPSASNLASLIKVPVVFHTHNMSKAISSDTLLGWVRRSRRLKSYRLLRGLIVVSDACRREFLSNWPDIDRPVAVVPNGLDFSAWNPAETRTREIMCVGRAAPEKGILEAALAMEQVLSVHTDWAGRLVLAEPETHPQYMDSIRKICARIAGRITIEQSVPHARVQQCYERAAIALVPSRWDEPFGRTGLEAHAGGCAVISSGTGGLAEIHGDCGLLLPKSFSVSDITQKLTQLINDPDLRTDLASSGNARARAKFAIDNVSHDADDFYSRVIERPRPNRVKFCAGDNKILSH